MPEAGHRVVVLRPFSCIAILIQLQYSEYCNRVLSTVHVYTYVSHGTYSSTVKLPQKGTLIKDMHACA
jgi:hypothetical protein